MTIDELIQLRDQVRRLQQELEGAEGETKTLTEQFQAAQVERDAALARLQDVRNRLAELIAARDQIPGTEAEIQSADAAFADLSTQLATQLNNLIIRFRQILQELRRSSSSSALNELEAAISDLEAGDVDTRVAKVTGVADRLAGFLARRPPSPFSGGYDPGWAPEIRSFELRVQRLHHERSAAAASALAARERLQEMKTRRAGIPQAEAEVRAAETEADRLAQETTALESELNVAMSRLESLRRQFTDAASQYQQQLDRLISELDRDIPIPIALLPIRLETRFQGSELWLRIYPDDLHQDSHQPGLTADEVVWGKQFWEQSWRAGKQAAYRPDRLQAWIQLASRFGPARAAWIARSLKPENHENRPDDPVAKDKTLTPAPDFPAPPPTAAAYHTKVLPDRWLAIAYISGQKIVQWGDLIPHPLEMDFSSGNSWMVDFEEAVKVGMGMRIPLPGRDTEVNLLLVLGVKGTQDNDQSAALLHSLFEAHHYTWGLDLAPVGTPTNNTEEARSGYAGRDPDFESSFETEIESTLGAPSDLWDGLKAARALGLEYASPFVFAQVQHADASDQIEARYLQTVLWPATWGYFLTQLMNDPIFQENNLDEWRNYYAELVRARGPLPTLRIGDQPYGLLPVTVTSPEKFVPTSPGEGPVPAAVLIDWLHALRGLWRNALTGVPRFNQTQPFRDHVDPGQNLLAMQSMHAVSASYHGRSALGPRYTENLWWLVNKPIPAEWSRQLDDLTSPALNKYGLPTQVLLNQMTFAANTFPLSLPLVQEKPVSETETLEDKDNYIAWLSKATPQQIHDHDYDEGRSAPKTLLYLLLRHATLQAYADMAFRLRKDRIPSEPELVDLWDLAGDPTSSKTRTSWRYLHFGPRLDGSDRPDQELLDLLSQDPASDPVPVKHLREFLNQLRHLSQLPTARLERLLVESLDLSAYRLDAWITSCATHRLQEMRSKAPSGIRIGGYGWVENLRPRSKATDQSAGYVHTPSLSQAATAAVLRCGYLSHSTEPSYQALALDLSSRRVRLAKWLLDGVRNGQPLGALLGYRFERGLHENHPGLKLDKYIAPFRELAPLAAGRQIPKEEGQSLESIAANNVVDGLALRNRWKKGKEKNQWDLTTIPFGDTKFPPKPDAATGQQDYRAVEAELNALEDAVDAISDVLLAESVHQAIQGNPLRSGASLDALSRHETPPQELDFIRTPRTGVALTQRLLVLFDGAAVPAYPAAWMPTGTTEERIHKIARQARAAAEPRLNAWVGKLLGNPAKVSCKVEYLHPTTDEVLIPAKEIKLSELNLSPLDILYAAPLGEQAQRSDLEQWIIYHALRNRLDGIPADAGIRILYNQAERTADELSFPELLEIARAARELILGARALDQRDLYQPGQDVPSSIAGDERIEQAVERLKHLLHNLTKLLHLPSTGNFSPKDFDSANLQAVDLDELRETLLDFAYFGLPGAVPLSPAGDTAADQTTLLNQAIRLGRETTERLARINTSTDPQAKWEEVFGGGFRVLPSFDIPEGLPEDFSKRKNADNPASAEVVQWFQRVARVRDGAGRLDLALMYAEAINAGNNFDFQVAQLPLSDNDRWVGSKLDQGSTMSGGHVSIVAHTPGGSGNFRTVAGLVVDEWVEVAPNASETTGLTFHYDAPGACAPQAILLAVPPDIDQPWEVETLEEIVLEAFNLAKLRAVDPDALAVHGDLGHFLPALFFAYNKGGDPFGDTIATDFRTDQ